MLNSKNTPLPEQKMGECQQKITTHTKIEFNRELIQGLISTQGNEKTEVEKIW